MPIKVTCPKCGGVLHAPEDSAGKRGRCPTCATVLTIPTESPSGAGLPPVASPPPTPRLVGTAHPGLTPTTDIPSPPDRPLLADRPVHRPFGDAVKPSPAAAPAPVPHPPRVPEPSRQTFAPPVEDDEPRGRVVRGWKRVRRGLGLLQTASVFAFLSTVAVVALIAYEQFVSPLPKNQPGKLGQPGIDLASEIRVAAVGVPTLLCVLFTLFGRISLVGAPSGSMARGLARMSALATAFAIGGVVLAVFPSVASLTEGTDLVGVEPPGDMFGVFQRFGGVLGVTLVVLAEVWLLAGLGKMGVALRSRRLAGRSGGLLILGGLLAALAVTAVIGKTAYQKTVEMWWIRNGKAPWAKLGEHQMIAVAGAVAVVAFVVMVLYVRMTGSGRRAIREWLDKNAPVT